MLSMFVIAQLLLLPLFGGIYLGIRHERQEQARLFALAVERIRILNVSSNSRRQRILK